MSGLQGHLQAYCELPRCDSIVVKSKIDSPGEEEYVKSVRKTNGSLRHENARVRYLSLPSIPKILCMQFLQMDSTSALMIVSKELSIRVRVSRS